MIDIEFVLKKEYYLSSLYGSTKTFCNKAVIKEIQITYNGEKVVTTIWELYSFLLKVAEYNDNQCLIFLQYHIDNKDVFSPTTLRHLKEFIKQYVLHCDKKLTKRSLALACHWSEDYLCYYIDPEEL